MNYSRSLIPALIKSKGFVETHYSADFILYCSLCAYFRQQNRKLKEAYIVTKPADHFTTSWKLCREKNCDVMIFLDPFSVNRLLYLCGYENAELIT